MLRVYAQIYINLGAAMREVSQLLGVPFTEQIDSHAAQILANSLRAVRAHCDQLGLPVTQRLVDDLAADYADNLPGYQVARSRWDGIQRTFHAELESRLFIMIPSHRATYWVSENHGLCGDEMLALSEALSVSFPDAIFDVVEAGNCFACERYTACVYHQMRAAEYALVAVVDHLGLPEDRKASWDRMIQAVEGHVKKLASTKQAPDWKEQEKRYSDLCSWFTDIKNGWRNPVSHIPRTYNEATARGRFAALRTLFEHLKSYGISQTQMPPEPIQMPDEAGKE